MINFNTQADFNAVFAPQEGDPGYLIVSKDGEYVVWAKNSETAYALADQSKADIIPAIQAKGNYFKNFAEEATIDPKSGEEILTPKQA
ncbi:hypothetical protein QB910_000016 [Dabrowskivirus KKP3916]|uniref:Uncharacterized protein n=1 Tax=Alicyclobacillus phage KKP_3916 TaxID=3040651 RepID=A0AAT9V7F4_9CAUD|nr:hypothetical protein QB910_000016 [Alicyclobacillus phage KKP 3916]